MFIEIDGSVNINSNIIENLPLYSMSLYTQDCSIYDSQQLEKVYYLILQLNFSIFLRYE
jgi:hypothetical protein